MAKDPICGMEIDEKKAKSASENKSEVEKTTISVSGMNCASCAQTIEKALKKTKGVTKASVNYATQKASVEFNENEVDEDKLKQVVVKSGYKVLDSAQIKTNSGEARLKIIGMDNPHCVGTRSNGAPRQRAARSRYACRCLCSNRRTDRHCLSDEAALRSDRESLPGKVILTDRAAINAAIAFP